MAVDAIVSKLSSEALEKAVKKSDVDPLRGGSSFKDILNNVESGKVFAEELGIGQDITAPTTNLQSLGGQDISYKPGDEVVGISRPETTKTIVDLLGEVNQGQMQMDSLVNSVLYSEKRFSNQELLVIQAHVFHFAQMTELTVKVAEQGVSSVKSVLNTQVQ